MSSVEANQSAESAYNTPGGMMMALSRPWCVAVYAVLGVLLCGACGSAAPSREMLLLLNTHIEAAPKDDSDLSMSIYGIYDRLRDVGTSYVPRFGEEYVEGNPSPKVNCEIPAGTLHDQLDKIAESVGYVWYANGDWINFVPKSVAYDPDYVMNRRIAGGVIMSRRNENHLASWAKANGVSVAKEVHRMSFGLEKPRIPDPICPDPTALESPTLRQTLNIHESLYGNGTWVATVRVIPASRPYGLAGASIVYASSPLVHLIPRDGLQDR